MRRRRMNAVPTYGTPTNALAMDLAFSIHTDVEAGYYDVQYPEHEWYKVVLPEQVKSDINPGATAYGYTIRDKHGMARFISNGRQHDIPRVGVSMGAVQVPIAYSAISAELTNEDARQFNFGMNGDLGSELGEAMRKGCDNLVEVTVFFGEPNLRLLGWLNYGGITRITAAVGAGGFTEWNTKTAEEMVNDIDNALVAIWINTQGLIKPADIFLPYAQFAILGRTPMVLGSGGSGTGLAVTALEYLKKNNTMTAVTGKELNIIPIRYLAGAGVGNTDRMVIQERSSDKQILPFPLPYTLSEPVPVPLGVEWYAEQKFGGYHVKQQGSMMYVDGI